MAARHKPSSFPYRRWRKLLCLEGSLMKFVARCLFAGLTSLAGVTVANAADLGRGSIKDSGGYEPAQMSRPALFYARGDFTYSGNSTHEITELPQYTHTQTSVGASRGWGFGLGMYFSPNIRGDVTLDWMGKSDVRGTINDVGATVQGERQFGTRNMVGLVNLYYDFDTRSRFTPYLGVGLGFSRNSTTNGMIVISDCAASYGGLAAGCAATHEGASQTSTAGALMAGFSAKLGDRWSLDAGYRFLYLGDAKTGDVKITRAVNDPTWPQSIAAISVHDMYAHQFRVGMRMDVR
jgi:opacity protein-like surface antigen